MREDFVFDPKTNVDCWQACHELRAKGLTMTQIMQLTGMPTSAISRWLSIKEPPRRRPARPDFLANRQRRMETATCLCGGPKLPGAKRCVECERHIITGSTRRQHIARLKAWAKKTGYVPTANDAAKIIGLGRATAGEYVRIAFGPDPLNGAPRRERGRRKYREAHG